MNELDQVTEDLMKTIRATRIYKEYREQEKKLSANPELMARVNRFRAENFRMQTHVSPDELFEMTDSISAENEALRSIPEVNAYLDAELAYCKMIQRMCRKLIAEISFSVPDVESNQE